MLLMRLPCAELETEKLCCCLGSPSTGTAAGATPIQAQILQSTLKRSAALLRL